MKVQTLYAVAGFVWGLVLGPDAGLFAARAMGSVAWLYQYENGAWADWAIIPFGALIGLTVLFACFQFGAAAGRRYDEVTEKRRRHTKSVPWALLVLGIAVGAITALTIEDRQHAVVNYVQAQKDSAARLLVVAENIHRVATVNIDWPGNGETGRISLTFRGKRQGNYRLDWNIYSNEGETPLLGDSHTFRLGARNKSTDIPVSATHLANARVLQIKPPAADIEVDERFRLVLELRPILKKSEWEALPEDEAARLDDGDSILVKRARTRFKVRFLLRDGQIIW